MRTPWARAAEIPTELQRDLRGAISFAKLDYELEKVPVVTHDRHQPVGSFALRRVDTGKIISQKTMGKVHTILQNSVALDWFQPFLDKNEARLVVAGNLNDRVIWLMAAINARPMEIVPGDTVEKHVVLSHAHDGTYSIRVGFSAYRWLCSNILARAHADEANKFIRIRHTRSAKTHLGNVRDIMSLASQEFEATEEQYRLLARREINQADLVRYVKRVLKLEDELDISERSEEKIQEILNKAEIGLGNAKVAGTLWAAYNGVTDWLAYEKGRNQQTRLNNLLFGDSAKMNQRALEIALSMAA